MLAKPPRVRRNNIPLSLVARSEPRSGLATLSPPSRGLGRHFSPLARGVTISRTHPVKGENFAATTGGLRFRAEIEFDGFPGIAALCLETQCRSRLIAAVHHAIFATTVACDSVHHPVSIPLGFFEQFCIAGVMRVGHEVAWPLPSANISRRDRPG